MELFGENIKELIIEDEHKKPIVILNDEKVIINDDRLTIRLILLYDD